MKIEPKRFGNSIGFLLPRELAIRLGFEEGRSFFLRETPDGGLLISRDDPELEATLTLVDGIMDEYDDLLRGLAK